MIGLTQRVERLSYEARTREDLTFWERKLAAGPIEQERRYSIERHVEFLRCSLAEIERKRDLRGRDID